MIAAIAPPIAPHTAGFTDAGTFIVNLPFRFWTVFVGGRGRKPPLMQVQRRLPLLLLVRRPQTSSGKPRANTTLIQATSISASELVRSLEQQLCLLASVRILASRLLKRRYVSPR